MRLDAFVILTSFSLAEDETRCFCQFELFFLSGKRDSNSRPQPWQGCALPTELFPHYRGQGQIRTAEAVRQQIYSLPVLTTYLPTQSTDFRQNGDSCGIQTHNLLIRSQMLYSVELRSHNHHLGWALRDSNPRPSACKADALNQLS